jgi:uncharacterized membrane protein HdeD (DUF308 family)
MILVKVQKGHSVGLRRVERITAGVIVLILAVYLFFNPNIAIDLLSIIAAIALIILGVELIVRGVTTKIVTASGKLIRIILGIIAIALGFAAIAYTGLEHELLVLVTIFAIGLLLNAIGRISFAGYATGAGRSQWLQRTSFGLCIIALIIAIAVIFFPGIGFVLLVYLVALALLLLGIELIVSELAR